MKSRQILQLTLAVVTLSSVSVFAEDWKPANPKLMTEWGEQVTPDSAWREYPRPQFVREQWLNLNGLWDYAIANHTAPKPAEFDGRILVPFAVESALSGVGRACRPGDRIWYRREVEVPADWGDDRVLLHFGAVDYASTVWVNGGLVGSHVGGSDAFTFDVTDFLREGKNELVVAVTDPTDAGEQPRGKQQLEPHGIWYTPVSGIWQTVWMEPVPRDVYLSEIRLTPDVQNSGLKIVPLTNRAVVQDDYAVRVVALADGAVAGSTTIRVNREGWLPIQDVRLWSPESPFLYDLLVDLVRVESPTEDREKRLPRYGDTERDAYADARIVGEPLDSVKSYFAMRSVSVGPGPKWHQPHLLLNGEPIFQHGPLDQGWWPDGLLTPPSDAAMAWELEWLKEAGFNMLRKHIKIEPARYYYHCDRLGLLVWQDMPSGFNHGLANSWEDEGEPVRLSVSAEQHELELRRMINRLYNHPSIVMWIIHNEGWGQYESPALGRWVKAIDPSRWVNAISGWLDQNISDVYDIHTYHEVPLVPRNQADRAIVIGEYGGVGWPIEGHLWDPGTRNWGYQTYHSREDYLGAVRRKIEEIIKMRNEIGLAAAVYTQTTDVEGEVNGFLTYDRKPKKVSPEELRELNARLVGPYKR